MKQVLLCGAILLAAIGCSSSTSTDPDLEAWTREVTGDRAATDR